MAPPISRGSGRKKLLTHAIKLEIIKKKEDGKGNTAIGREMGLSESTVRTVWKNREAIKKTVKAYGASALDGRSRSSNPAVILMERYLAVFCERKAREGVELTNSYVRENATLMYRVAKRKVRATRDFKASVGWAVSFLKRKGFRNISFTGERASADEEAANQFPAILKNIIDEGGYTKDQIYNLDETALYYRAMPKKTYISKEQKQARGRKLDKSRVTVMFCVNLSGSYKMRPVVVHTAAKPRCYKNLRNMNDSGVYWYKSANGWMTGTIFSDWLKTHCIPAARRKSRELHQDFKMLILMDNAPAHPTWIQDLVPPECKIVFMPPRTTSLIQPLDQDFIATVKQIYHKKVYDYLREKTETNEELHLMEDITTDEDVDEADSPVAPRQPSPPASPVAPRRPLPPASPSATAPASPTEDSPPASPTQDSPPASPSASTSAPRRTPAELTVIQFWKRFTIKDGVDFLLKSWDEVNFATINHAWRPLVPHLCVPADAGNPAIQPLALSDAENATLEAAQAVPGLQDLTLQDIQEAHSAEPEQDPEEIQRRVDEADEQFEARREGEEEMQGEQSIAGNPLPMRNVSHILLAVERLKEELRENETCQERSSEVVYGLDNLFRYYTDKHKEEVNRRRQSLITTFFRQNQENQEIQESEEDDDVNMSVVSALDFEGFMEEVERSDTRGGSDEESGDEAGPSGEAGPSSSQQ